MILSNPFLALGLFFIVMALWIVLAAIVLRHPPTRGKAWAGALLAAVLIWAAAAVPSFLFFVDLAAAMWYLGELASVFLATLVIWRYASDVSGGERRGRFLRRLGLGAGVSTALLMLVPVATYFVEDFEVYAIFDPIVFYLPYIVMLVTAALATICFALVPGRTSGP